VRHPPFSDSTGFSLIDALLAGALLSGGILALAQLFVVATGATSAARRTTVASILAAQKMEELRAGPLRLDDAGTDRIGGLTREWVIAPHTEDPFHTAIIQVSVAPGGVQFMTIRTRTVP
jgi:Tfp pilus assembly protein PilV